MLLVSACIEINWGKLAPSKRNLVLFEMADKTFMIQSCKSRHVNALSCPGQKKLHLHWEWKTLVLKPHVFISTDKMDAFGSICSSLTIQTKAYKRIRRFFFVFVFYFDVSAHASENKPTLLAP